MQSHTTQAPVKQRIRRIKTQHDQRAKINHSLLHEQTKKLHKDKINYAIYAEDKADELFPLKQVDIVFVQSYTFKDDLKFKEIRHLLQKYNEQVLRYDEKSSPGLHLKTKVIDSMLKFMRLMFQAPDSTAQKKILDVAHFWFKKNLDNQKGKKRTKQQMEKEIRTILTQTHLVPNSIIDKELPSQKRKEELHNYQILARTKYPQINPPAVQLENFVTHKLGFVSQGMKGDQQDRNKTQQEIREEKWKQRVIFKKPVIYEQNYDELQDDRRNEEQRRANEVQNSYVPPQNDTQNKQHQALNAQQQNTQQQQQNEAAMQQLDMGIPDDGDAAQQQPQAQQQDHKRGKLDPLVKIFLRDRQKRTKTEGQVKTQQRYNHTQQWKLSQQRLDEINSKFMTQWSGNRARFKSELSRKIQSIRAFTSVSKAKEEATSVSLNPLRVENTIYKSKLNQTLKEYGSYINHQPQVKDAVNAEKSMSVFDRKRVKTQVSSTMKHFSSVLEDNKRLDQKSEYLDEIQKLKEKFAKYKLYTPLESFKNAIMHPEEKESKWADLDKQLSEGIQLPRSQMLSNPFFKVAKKKKKKGGKKK